MNTLEYSLEGWEMLTASGKQNVLLRSMLTSDIHDLDQLRIRLLEHVHVSCLEGSPVRLASLNRRFQQAIKRVNQGSLIEILLMERDDGNEFIVKRIKGSTLLATNIYMIAFMNALNEMAPKDPDMRGLFIEENEARFWERAQ